MYIKQAVNLSEYNKLLLVDVFLNQDNDFVANVQGDIDAVYGLLNVKEALFRRLVTPKGALFWASQYGTRLLELLNSPASQGNLDLIEMQVRVAIDQEERIEKNAVVKCWKNEADDNVLNISILCELVGSEIPEELNYEIFVNGSK